MTFAKGKSGNPGGRSKDKPFADALRMELAEAGDNHKRLRAIAKKLLDKAEDGDMPAINAVADRLDGKPHQETEISTPNRPLSELSDEELTRIIRREEKEREEAENEQTAPNPESDTDAEGSVH